MTIEDFIADHQARKKELKQKDDELDFANKLVEKLRSENKQMKEDIGESLDKEIEKEKLKQGLIKKMEIDAKDKHTDTADLANYFYLDSIDNFDEITEDDNPDLLKRKLAELSKKLREGREQITKQIQAPIKDTLMSKEIEGPPSTEIVRQKEDVIMKPRDLLKIGSEKRKDGAFHGYTLDQEEQLTDEEFKVIDDSLRR